VGKREGPWSTHHPNGKLALQANYRRGLPEGRWTSFYDNGHPAIVVSFRRGIVDLAPSAFAGFSPDGTPWPTGAKLLPCNPEGPCTNPLEHLDFESLPPVVSDACPESAPGQSRPLPRTSWPPVLDAIKRAWPANPGGGEIPGPERSPCITQIRLSCAPNLDGLPDRDILAEISYRFLLNSEKNCATKNLLDVWDMKAVVTLSPPAADRKTWKPRGIVGYPQCMADVCPGYDTITGFVLLPSGEVGIRVRMTLTGGECRDEKWEEIRTLGKRGPTTLAARKLWCVKW
jgi:hypothetical protein